MKRSTKTPATKTVAKTNVPQNNNTNQKRVKTSVYQHISHHIYFDGYSYRVRASVNGTQYSQNFSSKKKAFEFRKAILNVVN